MNKYDTGNYNSYCSTAVWKLTTAANIALIPQQHVIHQVSKYQIRYQVYFKVTDIDNNTPTMLLQPAG